MIRRQPYWKWEDRRLNSRSLIKKRAGVELSLKPSSASNEQTQPDRSCSLRTKARIWDSSASGSVRNEKVYLSENPKAVRVVRNWYKKLVRSNRFSGLRLMYKEGDADRVSTLLDDLDRAKYEKVGE